MHADTRELFYGGAGGGGKSQALWYGALQFVDVPGYAALILRRSYADLAKAGALMDRSKAYLVGTGAVWKETDKRWTFPGGASITFGYLEKRDDELQYASAEFQYIAFDELTHFPERQYTFLFTRLRRNNVGPVAGVPLRMRSASNPGGPGHAWVYKRFIDPKTRDPKRVFIPASMDDNLTLDKTEYRSSLSNTDPLTRERIEKGDWSAIEGGLFKPEWFQWYRRDTDFLELANGERFLPHRQPVFMTCDPAASAKQTADWTVLSTFCTSPKGCLVWLACQRWQKEVPDVLPLIHQEYRRWKPLFIGVEEVASNSAVGKFLRRLENPNVVVKPLSPKGKDKKVRAVPATILAHDGRLFLPEDNPAFPLDDVTGELTRFTGNDEKDAHNDIVDTLSYGVECWHQFDGQTGGVPVVYANPGPAAGSAFGQLRAAMGGSRPGSRTIR